MSDTAAASMASTFDYEEDLHPRDSHGRWGSGGGGDTAAATAKVLGASSPVPLADVAAAREYLAKIQPVFTEQQRVAVEAYTGSQYRAMNGALRDGSSLDQTKGLVRNADGSFSHPPLSDLVKQVDSTMKPSPDTLQGTRFLRASALNAMGAEKGVFADVGALVGQTFTDKGYTSASLDPGFRFQMPSTARLDLTIPKGTMMVSPGSATLNAVGEGEVILGRGQQIAITGARDSTPDEGGIAYVLTGTVLAP